jgi:glucose uptake protein GlcU
MLHTYSWRSVASRNFLVIHSAARQTLQLESLTLLFPCSMSMQRSGNVAVFWDYGAFRITSSTLKVLFSCYVLENCPAPASTSGYAIANSISALARSFGSLKVFRAYQEISDQSRTSLRSELQSSGVSLVDCPHNGRKDVADKMILGQKSILPVHRKEIAESILSDS